MLVKLSPAGFNRCSAFHGLLSPCQQVYYEATAVLAMPCWAHALQAFSMLRGGTLFDISLHTRCHDLPCMMTQGAVDCSACAVSLCTQHAPSPCSQARTQTDPEICHHSPFIGAFPGLHKEGHPEPVIIRPAACSHHLLTEGGRWGPGWAGLRAVPCTSFCVRVPCQGGCHSGGRLQVHQA